MFRITELFEISTSHLTADKKGNPTSIHGHKWHIKVSAEAKELNEYGKIEEFKDFRKKVKEIIDRFNHKYLNDLEEFKNLIPTEERAAQIGFKVISDELNNDNFKITAVELWDYPERKVCYYQ